MSISRHIGLHIYFVGLLTSVVAYASDVIVLTPLKFFLCEKILIYVERALREHLYMY